jgi:hypothetical protein
MVSKNVTRAEMYLSLHVLYILLAPAIFTIEAIPSEIHGENVFLVKLIIT